jgi:hypothetical protein
LLIGVRPRRSGGWAAAENGLAEIAEETAVFLTLLGALPHGRLELGDPVGRSLQSLLLDKDGLGQDIGRVGGSANRVVDERFSFGVTLRRGSRVDALEKATKHLAFFGGHVALPAAGWPRPAYSDPSGQSKPSVRVFRATNALFPDEDAERAFLTS